MKILAISQARIASTRLPEKILKSINGETLLEIHLKRIQKSRLISKILVATTVEPQADMIVSIARKLNIGSFKGSVDNVLDRFYKTALPEKPEWVVRLTSDCPLIDPTEIDKVIQYAVANDLDYVSNTLELTYPDGLDTEVFKFAALDKAHKEAKLTSELEHVTPYIWKNSTFKGGRLFTSDCIKNDIDLSSIRLTVDTLEDFYVIKKLIELLGTESPWIDYVNELLKNPEILKINQHLTRNEGYEKSINNDKRINNG